MYVCMCGAAPIGIFQYKSSVIDVRSLVPCLTRCLQAADAPALPRFCLHFAPHKDGAVTAAHMALLAGARTAIYLPT